LRIFITGSTSFIGKNLVKELLKENHKLYLYKRKTTDISVFEELAGDYYFIDDINLESCFLNNEIESVIHLATCYGDDERSEEIHNANVVFPKKILNLATKYKAQNFINTDTFFSKEEFPLGYKKQYVLSKRNFLLALNEINNQIKVVNLRLEHVFGIGDGKTKFVEWLSNEIIANDIHKPIMLSSCNQLRDFISVEDVVSSYVKVINNIDSISSSTEFQVGRGKTITVKDFVNYLADEFSSKLGRKINVNFDKSLSRKGEVRESYALNENLVQLGWSPKNDLKTDIKNYVKNRCDSS